MRGPTARTIAITRITVEMEKPRVSVLVASVNGSPMIEACLDALSRQTAAEPAEVVVADATDEPTRAAIRARFPHVLLLSHPRRTTIPVLRAAAFDASTGSIVAVTEDHCIPQHDWIEEIDRAHRAGADAVGGPVENGSRDRLVDWAVYFCEYAGSMAPAPEGETQDLPGVNVAYKRELLARHRADLELGFWEGIVHPRLLREGARFVSSPRVVVIHKKRFGFVYFVGQRFHYSRYYAGTRMSGASPVRRGVFALATPLLPALLAYRIARAVLSKRRNRRYLALSAPALASFLAVWAIGELVGALLGPGDSLARIE